jgi:hypothetical protein
MWADRLYLSATHLGLGRDVWDVAPDNIDGILKVCTQTNSRRWTSKPLIFFGQLFFIGEFLYIFVLTLTKLAVLAFYLRVFPQKGFRTLGYAVMGFVVAYFVTFMFVLAFQCTPTSFVWLQWREPGQGRCINVNAGSWALAAITILLDLAILSMPVPVVLRLQISRQQKLQVLSMFGVGSL